MDDEEPVIIERSIMGKISGGIVEPPVTVGFAIERASEAFDDGFSRCHKLLHFIACRILGSPQGAGRAVQNCWLTASHNPRTFDCEGEFRSWLLRVLIDEASLILHHRPSRQVEPQYAQL
jgi:DNA-directed RNA polymerase specialized sigma24 family protein